MSKTPTEATLVATFAEPTTARDAARALFDRGVGRADLSLVMADTAAARQLLEDGPAKPLQVARLGSAVGGTLLGLSAVALAGPFGLLAVGPLAALMGGAVAGAGVGGLLGALLGLGIPEHEAALRAEEIRDGGALLTCAQRDEAEVKQLRGLLEESGARDVFTV